MNYYVVVEGEVGEKKVYAKWIPFINSGLTHARTLGEVQNDCYFITAGGGYPNLFEIISAAIDDVILLKASDSPVFDRLVIAVDAEEMSLQEKHNEITSFVDGILMERNKSHFDYRVVVQNSCLESWALGNRRIVSTNIREPLLRDLLSQHNVALRDPELLPPLITRDLNRAQTAMVYLKLLINNKFRNLSYTKSNPSVLFDRKYFDRLRERLLDTGHIQSFSDFIDAFS